MIGIGVDEHGFDVAALPADTTAVLVTPAHQFPTGLALSTARRAELLRWAAERGGLVIEDDYDAEFRYDHRRSAPSLVLTPPVLLI